LLTPKPEERLYFFTHLSDIIVLDADGAVVVGAERAAEVLATAQAREAREAGNRTKFQAGQLSIDLYNLRAQVADRLPGC
jgi:4-hydroxy-4-methyl-2-oxoglutarate aldolase